MKPVILFVEPLSRRNDYRYSLGILYISAYLREKGYDNTIFDFPKSIQHKSYTAEMALGDCISFVKDLKPTVIFFTASTTEAYEVVQLLHSLRGHANFISAIGGYHASSRPADFIEHGFDYVLQGEAEKSAHALVQALDTKGDLSNIPGLVWKRNGVVITNRRFETITDLDELPLPAYDKITMEKYVRMHDGIVRGLPFRAATVAASRGCPFNCCFCGSNLIHGRKLRVRAPESIEEEIRLLRDNYSVEAIWFVDDTLTVNRKHIQNVCGVMKKLNLFWACQARINCLDEELIKLMKDSGCLQVEFGIESGSKRILDEIIGKGFDVEKVDGIISLCEKYGIRTLSNFIIGFPTETEEEMQETIRLIKKIHSSFYRVCVPLPLPGTRLYEMVGEDISLEDYAKTNFYGGKNAERYNRSKIRDLARVHQELHKMSLRMSLINSFRDIPLYVRITTALPRKRERISYALNHVVRFLRRNV